LPKTWEQLQVLPYPGKLTLVLSLFLVILFIAISCILIKFKEVELSSKSYWLVISMVLVIAFVWQFILTKAVTLNIEGWDPWTIFQWVTGHGEVYPDYFSYNPNNMVTMYFYQFTKMIQNLFGRPLSWLALSRMNAIVMIIATFLFAYIVRHFLSSLAALFSVGLFALYFTWSPLSVVPYSDTLSLLPALLAISLLLLAKHYRSHPISCALLVVVSGFISAISYYTKASSVIFLIAFIGASLMTLLRKSKIGLKQCSLLLSLVIGFVGGFYTIKQINQSQTLVTFNRSLATPMTHYLAIGASEKGWWNQPDQDFTRSFSSYQERSQKNMDKYVQRVNDRGINGYIDFLKYKNGLTFNDGTLGWYEEGGGKVVENTPSKDESNQNSLRQLLYGQGAKTPVVKYLAQVLWIILWLLIVGSLLRLLSKKTQSRATDWMLLTVLGGFIFLSLFESGRGRYVIQFLPYYFILAGFLFNNFKEQTKKDTR
jgi:integral membrane protein (TIGR03766 family)